MNQLSFFYTRITLNLQRGMFASHQLPPGLLYNGIDMPFLPAVDALAMAL